LEKMTYWVFVILTFLILAHLVAAVTATIVVLRDRSLSEFQRFWQLTISWFGIYVGPLFILYLINEHSPELVPGYAQEGFVHWALFAPIKPAPHRYLSSLPGDDTWTYGGEHGFGGGDSSGHDSR
jgi:hypothetical protein